jgi:hypothetical protein
LANFTPADGFHAYPRAETSKCLKRLAFGMLTQALHACQASLPT